MLIVLINAVSGFVSLRIIKDLGLLVNQTYDKALMAGTFAQAAKFDFSQYDNEIQGAILSTSEEEFSRHMLKEKKFLLTLKEDLMVVEERSLSSKSKESILKVSEKFVEIESLKAKILDRKSMLRWNDPQRINLDHEWRSDKKMKSVYRSLTAISDDAAEVGYHFRLSSDAKNEENFKRTITILGACLSLSLILSILISLVIIRPLRKLQNVCRDIALGNFTVRSDVSGKDEFGTLSKAFNLMLNTIQEKTDNVATLLGALPFGLFYFDESGQISTERSKATDLLFKNFSSYHGLEDFYKDNNCDPKDLHNVLKAIFEKLLPFKSAVFLLPQRIVLSKPSGLQIIRLSYRPKLGAKGKLERVIMLGEDITDAENAKSEGILQAERVERVSKISSDIAGYKEFLISSRALIEKLKNPQDKTDFARDLHSLKGILGVYAYHAAAHLIHEMETHTENTNLFENIEKTFEAQTADVVKILGLEEQPSMRYFDQAKVEHLAQLIAENENPALQEAMDCLDRFPIEKALSKYSGHIASVVTSLEDKEVEIVFDPSDEISFKEVQRLDPVFIHVLNNSLDHGIESTSERSSKNKSPVGQIRISCHRLPDNSLRFKISDDGKGIDGQYLYEKALKQGLLTSSELEALSDQEKLNLIFKAGLSSKDSATVISGRGIGMDAVKSYLETLRGSIQLFSALDEGTTFELIVPPAGDL